ALYAQLGIESAIWAWPEHQLPEFFESGKPLEYLLEIEEHRIIAYVDEVTWSPYLNDKAEAFKFSRTPKAFEITSILVAPPIKGEEVKEVRRYCASATGHCHLVESIPWWVWVARCR